MSLLRSSRLLLLVAVLVLFSDVAHSQPVGSGPLVPPPAASSASATVTVPSNRIWPRSSKRHATLRPCPGLGRSRPRAATSPRCQGR